MRVLLASITVLAVLTGCGGRAVKVSSPAPAPPPLSVTVTNSLTQAIMVTVVSNNQPRPAREVPAQSTVEIPMGDLKPGDVIQLKATTADGARTYTKDSYALSAKNSWSVP